MSYIATMFGVARYHSEEDYKEVLKWLQEQEFRDMVEVDDENLEIRVEYDSYRNLGRNTDKLLQDAVEGVFVGTATSPTWHGFVDTTSDSKEVNLDEWAREHGYNPDKFEDAVDERVDWQSEVEQDFLETKREEFEDMF